MVNVLEIPDPRFVSALKVFVFSPKEPLTAQCLGNTQSRSQKKGTLRLMLASRKKFREVLMNSEDIDAP